MKRSVSLLSFETVHMARDDYITIGHYIFIILCMIVISSYIVTSGSMLTLQL